MLRTLILLVAATSAWACSCFPERPITVNNGMHGVSVVIRVQLYKELPEDKDYQMRYFNARVPKFFKGDYKPGRIVVATGAHGGLCGVALQSRQTWLLYGNIENKKVPGFVGEIPVFYTASCAPHRLFKDLKSSEKKQLWRFRQGKCYPEDCSPTKLAPQHTCPDGSTAGTISTSCVFDNAAGGCELKAKVRDCPDIKPPQCGPDSCGPLPKINQIMCPDGSVGGTSFFCGLSKDTGECEVQKKHRECPVKLDCTKIMCPAVMCPDGQERIFNGSDCCGTCVPKVIKDDPPSCGPDSCGDLPPAAIEKCYDGTVAGTKYWCGLDDNTETCAIQKVTTQCPLDCRLVRCARPICEYGYQIGQKPGQCCGVCELKPNCRLEQVTCVKAPCPPQVICDAPNPIDDPASLP